MTKTIECKSGEQEAFIAVPVSLSQEPDVEESEKDFSWASCGESCLLAILPCLLFIQFGVAYLTESPPQIHWMIVNFGIACFIGTALIFRRAFNEPESLVALIPEVLIDVILGLILFEKTEIAAIVMFGSILSMGVVAVAKLAMTTTEEEEVEVVRRGDWNA
ncbi:expressed unknown protein [Seminavis robusta]|uniref:Uncharacterized protein n=1 Tax=Seminavis robusta TaxID=568900 RepID=A0A9N8H1Y5_9STRA|nr:expressed unknown protein [Seminavis robusta]CAB9530361.1 expressed unknown protein [Seminavis robusta]|eukprot:Sro25_g017290.1 n/a (162) ;mRNA; r:148073-148558